MAIQKLAVTGTGAVTLDLAKEEDYNYVLKSYGGKELLNSYTNLKQLLEQTKAANARGEWAGYRMLPVREGDGVNGLEDAVYIAYAYYNQEKKSLDYECVVSLCAPAKVCNVQIDLSDVYQKQIGKKYVVYKNQNYMFIKDTLQLELEKLPQNLFEITMTVSLLGRQRNIMDIVVRKRRFCVQDIVGTTNIAHPTKKFTQDDTINVFFGRLPGRWDKKIDYIYNEAYLPEKNCAEMTLDVMGNAAFSAADTQFKEMVIDECEAIMDLKRGAFYYHNPGGMVMEKDGDNGFGWYFDSDWGGTIPKDSFQASNRSQMTMTLRYKASSTGDTVHTLTMTSCLEKDLSESCKHVRELDLKIGCFAKGTRITMADGSEREIESIRMGDHVIVDTNWKMSTVRNIFTGMEAEMVMIETENGLKLMVTSNHPIETDAGLCEAGKMNAGMKVLTAEGTMEPIKYLYTVEYNDRVYNLELDVADGEGRVIAEGIVAGDMYAEQKMQHIARTTLEEEPSPLYQEFENLNRYLELK